MSILSSRLQTKALKPQQPAYGVPYQLVNGRLVSITDNPTNYITKAYSVNDLIYSIIKMICDKIMLAPWSVYKIKDEQSLKKLHAFLRISKWDSKDFQIAVDLQNKALEIDNNPGKWGELMEYANEYETTSELVANSCAYKFLIGNKYMWADLLEAGANKGTPNRLENLPAQHMVIKATDAFPTTITAFENPMWKDRKFTPQEILHEKYWNPNWNINGEQLYGMSPLKTALRINNRDNSSVDSSTARFQNNGMDGILYLKNQAGNVEGEAAEAQVRAVKKTLVNEWTGEGNAGKIGISGYEMGWIPTGLSGRELQQIENEKWNLRRLCNIWGVQSQLLNDPDNKTYANQEEAEKSLTTRCALPALTLFRNNLNRKRKKDWGGKPGTICDFDLSIFSELQKDMGKMMEWVDKLAARTGMSPNAVLDLVGIEKIKDPYYDQPRVTTTMGLSIEEHNMSDVDDALNDES